MNNWMKLKFFYAKLIADDRNDRLEHYAVILVITLFLVIYLFTFHFCVLIAELSCSNLRHKSRFCGSN